MGLPPLTEKLIDQMRAVYLDAPTRTSKNGPDAHTGMEAVYGLLDDLSNDEHACNHGSRCPNCYDVDPWDVFVCLDRTCTPVASLIEASAIIRIALGSNSVVQPKNGRAGHFQVDYLPRLIANQVLDGKEWRKRVTPGFLVTVPVAGQMPDWAALAST